jgi:hypothetical protein
MIAYLCTASLRSAPVHPLTHPHAELEPRSKKKQKNSIGYLVCLVWEVDLVEYLDGLVLYGLHLYLVGRVLPLTGPAIATQL